MIVNLENDSEKYVVINIDSITGIKDFEEDPLFQLTDINGKQLNPNERFKRILSICLQDKTHFPASKVITTNHIDYFTNYLRYYDREVGFYAETIVIEKQYMSLSFLKDYSKYYSIGYNSYNKFCKRIHFFQTTFNDSDFKEFLNSDDSKNTDLAKKIRSHYLGHIVAKPLPNSLIGATLLRAYDEFYENLKKNNFPVSEQYLKRNRNYFALREYKVNLFGQPISFKSLVFQEQDRAVSACATVAIWMSLHKINELFRTPIPAPSEITESAGLGNNSGRNIPNQGLILNQIIKAIDNVQNNLVSEIFDAKDFARVAIARQNVYYKIIKPWKVKRYVYAYLRLQIPILLGYNIIRFNGNHLVTLTGYRFEKDSEELEQSESAFPDHSETIIRTIADTIVRLYSHDDQLGPFSKIGFDNNGFGNYLKVNWRSKAKYNLALAQLIVVPIVDFIRIRYNDIEVFSTQFQNFLEEALFNKSDAQKIRSLFIWDIYIIQSNEYKIQIRNSNHNIESKLKFQIQSYPQYIWIAGLRVKSSNNYEPAYDFIFDATDTPKSMNLFDVYYHSDDAKELFNDYFGKVSPSKIKDFTRDTFLGMTYLSKIIDTLKENE